jgi:predicted phage terminase large subunit-like protein
MDTVIRIKPHDKQLEILRNRKRFNVVRCGRRFGKSYLAFALALEKMLEVDGSYVLYTAPSYTELSGRETEAQNFFAPLGATYKQGQIKLGRSTLVLQGIYRADGLRGNKFHRVICDEWAHCPNAEDDWNFVLSPMLADYEGDAYFFSTPKGKNHFWQLDQLSETMQDWQSFHYSTYDGGQIKISEVDRQKELLPSLVFAQEFLAEYVDRSAAKIKREWLRTTNGQECTAYYIGVDLAISQKETADYTAIVVIGTTKEGEVVVVEADRFRAQFQEIGRKINSAEQRWNARVVAVESNQAQAWMVQELKRNTKMNVVGVRADRDKVIRFQPVEARYEQGLVYHVPHINPEFTEELLSFTGTPQDKHDDFIDALGHAFNAIRKTPQIYV